jgi:hypothetical protein
VEAQVDQHDRSGKPRLLSCITNKKTKQKQTNKQTNKQTMSQKCHFFARDSYNRACARILDTLNLTKQWFSEMSVFSSLRDLTTVASLHT